MHKGEKMTIYNKPRPSFDMLLLFALLAAGTHLHAQSTGLVVTSSNNVGIGTTSPSASLDIIGNTYLSNKTVAATNSASQPGTLQFSGYGWNTNVGSQPVGVQIAPVFAYWNGGSNSPYGQTYPDLAFRFLNSDSGTYTERMRITGSGNVGIGTTSPQALLHLVRPVGGNGNFMLEGNSQLSGAPKMFFIDDNGGAFGSAPAWQLNDAADLFQIGRASTFGTAVSSYITINSGGNVGIGTTSPIGKLDINGTSGGSGFVFKPKTASSPGTGNRHLSFEQEQGWGTAYFIKQIDNAGMVTNDVTLEFFPDDTNANPTMVVEGSTNGGNVGIGTTSPGYKLDVAGQVHASSFVSSTQTYADFVFKPDYKLAPLSDVEASIKKDGHLPGIPSEEEAKEHGIDLTQMQVKLLQKIEELTLHQIEQGKALKEQAQQIENLKKENTELRERIIK